MRRDITAETSLMNDLDKRLNTDLDSSSSTLPDQFSKRNVNLLISLPSDDNLHANSQVPVFVGDTSKTNSENGSVNGRSCQFSDISKFSISVCLPVRIVSCHPSGVCRTLLPLPHCIFSLPVCLPDCFIVCLSVCPLYMAVFFTLSICFTFSVAPLSVRFFFFSLSLSQSVFMSLPLFLTLLHSLFVYESLSLSAL